MPQNPKKEFTIDYSESKVRDAILKLTTAEPDRYALVKDDKVLNEIRLHQKGQFLDVGYHADFTLAKLSDTQTKVIVEISRNIGTINTASEVSIANNSLKTITSKFSAFLSGEVDPATGKAKIPQAGCMIFLLMITGTIAGGVYGVLKLLFLV